ncbi:hypothetical protein GCM10027214_25530 [Stenotrophomonas tumulicola]
MRAASTVRTAIVDATDEAPLPPPVPVEQMDQRVGVMVHVYYADLIEELAHALSHVPVPFTLLVSVMDEVAGNQARQRFSQLSTVQQLKVKTVENRGRDIAPLLVDFRDDIVVLDIIGHIHTKKSLYTGGEQQRWRHYLLESLFGSRHRAGWILGMFQAMPNLGMVYPESYQDVPLWGHTWLGNGPAGDLLAARLGIALDRDRYLDFPAGSMFWARVDALRPLFDLKLHRDEFPAERGQVDGTLQHAVERLFGVVVRHQGFRLGILPSDGSLALASEGWRNMDIALQSSLAKRLPLAALDAGLVTVDVFDTLVVRAFLTPAGARAHLGWRLQRDHGINDFVRLRSEVESALRSALQRDPTLAEIHQLLARRINDAEAPDLAQLELEHERQLLRPRSGVLAALSTLQQPLTALSDMYMTQADMQAALPAAAHAVIQRWWISCETSLRKDTVESWQVRAEREGLHVRSWLHIGDNEHADIQMPQLADMLTPVHVLRPSALLDVVPALRPLRHLDGGNAAWPEQLWRGLLANRFAALYDTEPTRLLGRIQLQAQDLGYVVLGPLLLDFLLSLVRTAQARDVQDVLFLSREGHLLHRAFLQLQPFHPVARQLKAHYFLASRKATTLPALHAATDVHLLVEGTFNGTLEQLVAARLGDAAVSALRNVDASLPGKDVFLPEMASEVAGWLAPTLPTLLHIAAQARDAYLHYWSGLGDMANAMVADIGYAGTIQRNLSHLGQKPLGGMYFALRARASQLEGSGWAEARYFDGRTTEDEAGSPILAHDLLLEALLSAPAGQFNGFALDQGGMPIPCFGHVELSSEGLEVLDQIHQGALDFIHDVCAAIGEDIADLVLESEGVQIPLTCLASGLWDADAVLDLLATQDSFTGRGSVAAGGAPG